MQRRRSDNPLRMPKILLALFLVGQLGLLAHEVLIAHGQQNADCEICLNSTHAKADALPATTLTVHYGADVPNAAAPAPAPTKPAWRNFRSRAPPHIA